MHRNKERGAFHHFVIIDVTGVDPGRSAADAARNLGWRHAHAAEERLDWNLDRITKSRQHASPVEWNDLDPLVRELVLKKSEARTKPVVRERRRQFDLSNANFEHVSRLGALHENRTSKNMAARPLVGHLFIDGAKGV